MNSPNDQWLRATEPLRTALDDLAAAYPDDAMLPDAESKATAELDQQSAWKALAEFAGWGPELIHSAHSIGVMQLRLAFDCALSLSHLIATDEITAIYSPAALLRPVLEATGRALWVLDTSAGVRERCRSQGKVP